MKIDLSQPKTAGTVIGGIIALLVILPNLDKGWSVVRYVTDAFPTAYSAQEKATKVDEQFRQYLDAQDANAKAQQAAANAINHYIQQQQQQAPNSTPTLYDTMKGPITEWDNHDNVWWCCNTSKEQCWAEQSWYRCPLTPGTSEGTP